MVNSYYINELEHNSVNTNRYVYIDSIDGDLDIKNNKWFFNLNFYVINNFSLPLNLLNTTINLPFARVEDISINQKQNSSIPIWVKQPLACKTYNTQFDIDINESKFFDQYLSNYDMYLMFSFSYDEKIINSTTFVSPTFNINNFIVEWESINQSINFKYSNFLKITDELGSFDNATSYYLNNVTSSATKQSIIYYEMNHKCNDLTNPLVHLLNLKVDKPTTILNIKYNFFYSVNDNPKIYQYKYEGNNVIYVLNNQDIDLNIKTSYDNYSNEITSSLNGIEGFYIPRKSIGYFEVEIKLSNDGNIKTYLFTKSFNFLGNNDKNNKKVEINEIFINQITQNFKRMEF